VTSDEPMTSCPTDDTLGAMLDRALSQEESDRVAAHLDTCDACQQVAIAAVRAGAMTPVTIALGTPSLPPLAEGTPIHPGATIGRFAVGKLLGAGGMGHVYEAYDVELDRSIALKVLRPELAGKSDAVAERLVRESRIMAKVVHPAVITVHDVGRDGDAVFIAMELIRGQTLGAFIATASPSWREIVALYERAGHGLAAAHAVGVVHRDFKPDNVLVEIDAARAKRVVVTDFGIARAAIEPALVSQRVHADVRLTATGATIGTPAYMAPEQLAGRAVDQRADVFAFAVSLWEALFGARPFPGATIDAIREAMTRPPRAPSGVPRRLVRALERGLAIDPAQRWPDLEAFTRELAAVRSRRHRTQLAAGAAGLVVLGVAGALGLAHASHRDPCAVGLDAFTYDSAALHAAVAGEPAARIDRLATAWRTTHAATCHAEREPIQPAAIAACLDARRIELGGVVDDLISRGPAWAPTFVNLIGNPELCTHPQPGLTSARVPDDPVLRGLVTTLRDELFAGEAARDKQDYKTALADAHSVVGMAAHVWSPVHAEALYLLGTTQSMASGSAEAMATLREAVAVAETAHNDYIAANGWIQLALSSTSDDGQPARGLEYTTYADAAIERLGRPSDLVALYDYVRGATLVDLHREKEAETALREAVALSEHSTTSYTLPQAIQGLGYLFEDQGRYIEAVDAYRRALAALPAGDHSASAIVFRERLAVDLGTIGKGEEAEAMARQAVDIATTSLGEANLDTPMARLMLAEVLDVVGKGNEALAQARSAVATMKQLAGDHGERYGAALRAEAEILTDLGHNADALPLLVRACDIMAAQTGDDTVEQADCLQGESIALSEVGRNGEALALIVKVVPMFTKVLGDANAQVANAIGNRGVIEGRAGQHAAALADLERAVAILQPLDLDAGHLAQARLELGKELWSADRPRARTLIATAVTGFEGSLNMWKKEHAEAQEWLATDGHPKQSAR
jgi:eukaryotic-like serine/threonine-protein kinase